MKLNEEQYSKMLIIDELELLLLLRYEHTDKRKKKDEISFVFFCTVTDVSTSRMMLLK